MLPILRPHLISIPSGISPHGNRSRAARCSVDRRTNTCGTPGRGLRPEDVFHSCVRATALGQAEGSRRPQNNDRLVAYRLSSPSQEAPQTETNELRATSASSCKLFLVLRAVLLRPRACSGTCMYTRITLQSHAIVQRTTADEAKMLTGARCRTTGTGATVPLGVGRGRMSYWGEGQQGCEGAGARGGSRAVRGKVMASHCSIAISTRACLE